MSIEYEPIAPVPTQTMRVAKAAFPKGNPYLTLRDELGPILSDLDESRSVLQDGKTGGAPLAVGISHKKCNTSENLSDRQAADDWYYKLHALLSDFPHSVRGDEQIQTSRKSRKCCSY